MMSALSSASKPANKVLLSPLPILRVGESLWRQRFRVRVSTKSPMLSPHDIHHGIILPAFLAAVILFIALIPIVRSRAHIVLLVSLTVPYLLSYMHLFDRPPLP